jgi:hypothetical protein
MNPEPRRAKGDAESGVLYTPYAACDPDKARNPNFFFKTAMTTRAARDGWRE